MIKLKIGNVEIEWFGHATFMVKAGGKTIYFDPFVLPNEPEKADLILITHEHYDHCSPEHVDKIKKEETVIITTESSARKLSGNVQTIKEWGMLELDGIKIYAVPAYNIDKPFHPRGLGVGFILEVENTRIYHAGDTDCIPEMKEVKADIALLPIGGTYTMNVDEAVKAALTIKPKVVIPMHFGYIEGTEADPNSFKEKVMAGSKEIEVVILKPL